MNRPTAACAPLLPPVLLAAQRQLDHNADLWITCRPGDHRVAARWSVHTEAHVRQAGMGGRPQQLLRRQTRQRTVASAGALLQEMDRRLHVIVIRDLHLRRTSASGAPPAAP